MFSATSSGFAVIDLSIPGHCFHPAALQSPTHSVCFIQTQFSDKLTQSLAMPPGQAGGHTSVPLCPHWTRTTLTKDMLPCILTGKTLASSELINK